MKRRWDSGRDEDSRTSAWELKEWESMGVVIRVENGVKGMEAGWFIYIAKLPGGGLRSRRLLGDNVNNVN